MEQAAEKPDPVPGEGGEEPFDRMRRCHCFGTSLDGCGIAIVFLEVIEVHEVGTRTIDKETDELLEDGSDRQTFSALSHRAEQTFQV